MLGAAKAAVQADLGLVPAQLHAAHGEIAVSIHGCLQVRVLDAERRAGNQSSASSNAGSSAAIVALLHLCGRQWQMHHLRSAECHVQQNVLLESAHSLSSCLITVLTPLQATALSNNSNRERHNKS